MTLQVKWSIILPAKCVYLGIVEELKFGICKYGKQQASPDIKGDEYYFMEKRGKLRWAALKESPLEESERSEQ